ncbi:MAG: helix-turn-helix domain-containing protein [Bacteroidetes bacterium]|nr:helix-turn-helix domain-containing protein [Bacteroidota bacterium]
MNIIVFEEESYWKMQRELMNMFAETLKKFQLESASREQWVTPDEAKKILGYSSKRKWQQLRDSGLVKYSQYGKKVKYSRESLYEYISKNVKK